MKMNSPLIWKTSTFKTKEEALCGSISEGKKEKSTEILWDKMHADTWVHLSHI